MARDYAIVTPQFWTGTTGREIRALGCQAQLVAVYLVTSPHANMLGLYYVPLPYISHETGIPLEGASKALRSLGDVGFALYDEAEEVVWVPAMARYQIGETLKATDKRVQGVVNELAKYRKSRFYAPFLERYAAPFNLPAMPPAATSPVEVETAPEAPSSPLRSQDQDQDQDQEQKLAGARARAEANPDDEAPDLPRQLPCVDQAEHPLCRELSHRIQRAQGQGVVFGAAAVTDPLEELLVERGEGAVEDVARFVLATARRHGEAIGSLAYCLTLARDMPPPEPRRASLVEGERWDELRSRLSALEQTALEDEARRLRETIATGGRSELERERQTADADEYLWVKWNKRAAEPQLAAGGTP